MARIAGGLAAAALSGAVALAGVAPEAGAESRVILSPAGGATGTPTSVVGAGLGKRDRVTVSAGGKVVATARIGRRGTFSTSFMVPGDAGRRVAVVTRSRTRRIVNAFLFSETEDVGEVVTRRGRRVRWTPGAGPVGSALNLEGSGFPRGRHVRIRLGPRDLAVPVTRPDRTFSALATIPALSPGRRFMRLRSRRAGIGFSSRCSPPARVARLDRIRPAELHFRPACGRRAGRGAVPG